MTLPARYRIDAAALVTINANDEILYNHSLVIDDGKIAAIIPTDDAPNLPDECIFKLTDKVIMPGLVNAHGHAAMSLFRGIANDLPLQEWLEGHIWPAEAQWVSAEFVESGTRLSIAEMLTNGTTTFSDMYFFPEAAANVVDETGIRAQLCGPILDFPTMWGSGPDEYIDKTLALFNEYEDHPRVTVAFGPHAPYTVSDEPLTNIATLAKQHGVAIQMHVHETQSEVDTALANTNKRPVRSLAELGLLTQGINFQAVHMTALDQADIDIVASAGGHVIHCPESNMKLASGFCPTPALLNAGVIVAIGTDGAASNNDLDMLGETRTAALIAKGYFEDASAISAKIALRMATINGAKALGLEDIVGSIEEGKQADIIALDMNKFHTLPSYDLAADLVYNTQSSQVTHVWVDGELLLDCGQLKTIDAQAVVEDTKQWAKKIKSEQS